MTKKTAGWICGAVAVVALCSMLFFFSVPRNGTVKPPAPRADVIATSMASAGTVLVENKTAGYAITIPQNWYLEKSEGSGVAIYPDYDASGAAPPGCKVEISSLPNNSREDLADWLVSYLYRDPTADSTEISRTMTMVGAAPAIIWTGVLNGVFSTLAYVAMGTDVYEIAPSAIVKEGEPINDINCADDFKIVLKNFKFIK